MLTAGSSARRLLGKQTSTWEEPRLPSNCGPSTVAALPLKWMTQLIWLLGLEKMKFDRWPLLFSTPIHPGGPGRYTSDQNCI